jgi:hypothetical protein
MQVCHCVRITFQINLGKADVRVFEDRGMTIIACFERDIASPSLLRRKRARLRIFRDIAKYHTEIYLEHPAKASALLYCTFPKT